MTDINSNPEHSRPCKTRSRLRVLALCGGLLLGATALAQHSAPEPQASEVAREAAEQARQAASQAQAEAHQQALIAAERQQAAALQAVEAARSQLEQQALEHDARLQAEQAREVQRELQHAHASLRAASHEVARVHRELERRQLHVTSGERGAAAPAADGHAVIGVILGARKGAGIEVLGVSPDGPAERAGVKPKDLIVSIMGTTLDTAADDSLQTLREALEGIEVDDEVDLGLLRDGRRLDLTVVAEQRRPFSWHSYSRLSSAPGDEDIELQIERIVVPEIDRDALDSELRHLAKELDEFSEFGDELLGSAGIWMGMDMTRGLRLTSLDPALGEYFNSRTGVLVLAARDDNALQLLAGDVILEIAGRPVASPVEVMRALREHPSGTQIDMRIMRRQQQAQLQVTAPD